MKIRDIPPGQFFINNTLHILWLKISDFDGMNCAVIVDNNYNSIASALPIACDYNLSRWPYDYENDEYSIIPVEHV